MLGYTAKMILLHFKSPLLSEQFAALMEIYVLYTNYFSSLFMFPKKDGEVPVQPLIRVIKIDFTIKKGSSALLFQAKRDKEADKIRNYRPTENSSSNNKKKQGQHKLS